MYKFGYISESHSLQGLTDMVNREFIELERHLNAPDHDLLWKDVYVPLVAGNVVAGSATVTSFRGFLARVFVTNDSVAVMMQINHDLAQGTLIYPYVHWSMDTTTIGTCSWRLDYSIAKGYGQEAFPTASNFTMNQTTNGTAFSHYVAEASEAQAITIPEIDSILFMKVTLTSKGALGGGDSVFGLSCGFHYQANLLGTPFKRPDFYQGG